MLVVIKKYKFFIRKTDFIKFIIKLGYINIDLRKIKAITYSTTEPATPPSRPLQNTPKNRYLNLKYLNYYLIIFSKNLNISFYIPILVLITI